MSQRRHYKGCGKSYGNERLKRKVLRRLQKTDIEGQKYWLFLNFVDNCQHHSSDVGRWTSADWSVVCTLQCLCQHLVNTSAAYSRNLTTTTIYSLLWRHKYKMVIEVTWNMLSAWSKGQQPSGAVLHLLCELGGLTQRLWVMMSTP